ncbi:MAG: DUF2059 domain-containing protein [Blastocatellia bacterium]
MLIRKFLLTGLLLCGFSLTSWGQSVSTIEPQKLALLRELLTVMNLKQITEKTMEAQFTQLESNFPQLMGPVLPNMADLPKETQEKIQQKAVAGGLRAMKRMRELYKQRIDLGAIVEQIYFPIYDKYYSADELKELVVFYRSPVGRKWVENVPSITQEAMQKSSELLLPPITAIMTEVMEEERALLQKEMEKEFPTSSPPPPPPPPAPRKPKKPIKR